jgi:hypothetical protein
VLFTMPNALKDLNHRAYDISRDDRRLLMIRAPESDATSLVLVLNWLDALKARSSGVAR